MAGQSHQTKAVTFTVYISWYSFVFCLALWSRKKGFSKMKKFDEKHEEYKLCQWVSYWQRKCVASVIISTTLRVREKSKVFWSLSVLWIKLRGPILWQQKGTLWFIFKSKNRYRKTFLSFYQCFIKDCCMKTYFCNKASFCLIFKIFPRFFYGRSSEGRRNCFVLPSLTISSGNRQLLLVVTGY